MTFPSQVLASLGHYITPLIANINFVIVIIALVPMQELTPNCYTLRELVRTDVFLELFLPVVREYNKLVSGSLVSERLDEVVEKREYFFGALIITNR